MKKALACTMLLGVVWSLPATAQTLNFQGGIGVHPVSSITGCPTAAAGTAPPPCVTDADESQPAGKNPHNQPAPLTVNLNVVRGVQPAGQIWVINGLTATVGSNGSISATGTGLVLAGGNNAGRPPAGAKVIATLICDLPTTAVPVPPQFSSSSGGVALSSTGGFTITDTLKNGNSTPPVPCTSPMLLIRNAANLGWFAVGIYTGTTP